MQSQFEKNSPISKAPTLDNLLGDDRLARLFTTSQNRACALQVWVLQIESEQSVDMRVVYGRLLPHSYSSNTWSFEDNDHNLGGNIKAQFARLNLYIDSIRCAELLKQLSTGHSISDINKKLGLKCPEKLEKKFGAATLVSNNLAYRPVTYLYNRDNHNRRSPCSPHSTAGAFSASITQVNKEALFLLNGEYSTALATSVVERLNVETGLNFGGADITRFGDIELLVFPTLDDREQSLLNMSWINFPPALVVRLNPMQLANFNGFQFRLSLANDGQIIYSGLATAVRDEAGEFVCTFELSDQLYEIVDSSELEIFGFNGDCSGMGLLCCLQRVRYFRELSLEGHLVNNGGGPVKFDWLEKTIRRSGRPVLMRAKAALTSQRRDLLFGNRIGRHKVDLWVPVNQNLISLFARIHPPKSEGQFLLRWSNEDPDSRLKFVEWFKALLSKYKQQQIAIFDPYFEDAGLGLVLICAMKNADYIVFRSLPKKSSTEKTEIPPDELKYGVDRLLNKCKRNRSNMRNFKLRIYGLLKGLHDRYILIIGADNLPVAGFNLSNSFQTTAQNFPLLITPIPADILLNVGKYMSGLVSEAEASKSKDGIENSSIQLLFDSGESPTVGQNYEPLHFLENHHAGDVLSIWVGEQSLQGLSGDSLREHLEVLDLLKDEELALSETRGLHNCLRQKAGNFKDFRATWEILCEVFAHSRIHECDLRELKPEPERGFLKFLERFLETSFSRIPDDFEKEVAAIDAQLFQMSVEKLLHSSYHLGYLYREIKYPVLTSTESYTIKFLWWYAPDALLPIAEAQMASVPTEPQWPDAVRLSLLSQILSEISLTVQFGANTVQRDSLIQSSNGLLQWIGLNAIEKLLENPGGLAAMLQLVAAFGYPERVRALGWMVHHAEGNPQKVDVYKGLVAALHETLPTKISAKELVCLVNSMRGHMQQLAWVEPWLFRDIVFPLLQNNQAHYDDVCVIWAQELAGMLEPKLTDQSLLFDLKRDGGTIDTTAFLFAYSSSSQQKIVLKSMREILRRQQRVVQQPLASTINWTRWNRALTVSLWLLVFFRWGEFYLRQRCMTDPELEQLSSTARELAMVKPMSEWRLDGARKKGELAAFLDKVDELLDTSDGPCLGGLPWHYM